MSFAAEGTQVVDLQGHTVIGPERFAPAPYSWWTELQPGITLGRRAVAGGRPTYAQRPGGQNAVAAMGTRGGRLERIPVCRTSHANPEELNEAAPDTPVFVLHLYDRALLNRAALKAVGYTKATPDPAGGEIVRDSNGNPTGMLIAKPNAMILYSTLAKGPKLPLEMQVNSTRQFMRELNRLGLTSAIDAGGGFQNYPEDYEIIEQLHANKQMTVRIAYNLFTQRPKQELEDFERWTDMLKPGQGTDFYRANGAGEMLVFSAADFEDFLQPRPDLPEGMEDELERVVRHRWSTAGRSACTPPTMNLSAACWTCLRR